MPLCMQKLVSLPPEVQVHHADADPHILSNGSWLCVRILRLFACVAEQSFIQHVVTWAHHGGVAGRWVSGGGAARQEELQSVQA